MGFKRKAEENNEILFWQGLPLTSELGRKQYELDQDARRKNEASDSKIMKGAEAVGIKAKGLAEAAVVKSNGRAESKVFAADAEAKKNVGIAQVNAIKSVATAEVTKLNAQTKLLEFELAQKQNAAAGGFGAKKSKAVQDKEPTKQKKPQTPEQIEYNRKRREKYAAEKEKNKQNATNDL